MMVRISPAAMYSSTDSRGMLRSRSACTARSRSFGASARARRTSSSAGGMDCFAVVFSRVSRTLMRRSPGFLANFAPACARARREIKPQESGRLDLGLVLDARQAFGAAEHGQHVEDAG